MSWAQGQELAGPISGGTLFLTATELRAELARAESRGLLPVLLNQPGPAGRGRLALSLEAAIEEALTRRGACPPGIGSAASLDESLSDQLYRSRLIELRGIALGLPPLEGLVSLGGALDPEDSAVLRWWMGATRERPVSLLIDRANSTLLLYGPPRPLFSWIGQPVGPDARAEPVPTAAPEVASSAASMELSDPPPAVVEHEGALAFQAPLDDETPSGAGEQAVATEEAGAADSAESREQPEHDQGSTAAADLAAAHAFERDEAHHDEPAAIGDLAEAILETLSAPTPDSGDVTDRPPELRREEDEEEAGTHSPAPPQATSGSARLELRVELVRAEPAPRTRNDASAERPREAGHASAASSPEPVAADAPEDCALASAALELPPLYPRAKDEWPAWVRDLEATRGPRPLAVIERTFVASYVPLLVAVKQQLTDPAGERAAEVWSRNFAQSYREAFDALRVRGKRPAMVLDAPDIALRTARLHGARQIQLLLIDGLRFDLGLRVEQRVRALMGQRAALAERLLLWSALPSTTEVQLELLGRGASGLAEPCSQPESEVPVARGRAAGAPRRVKAGHRDLFKLDLVEARLADPGPREPERLDALSIEVAASVAEFLSKQPARTLVLAFGDHGFCLDARDGGTTAARSGGASPEEVLVPAFAWLVGGLH